MVSTCACDMGSWAAKWQSQRMLVAVAKGDAPNVPRMNPQNWGLFGKLGSPCGDYDFVTKALWRKLAVASRLAAMTRNPKCSFDGLDETHDHVFGSCRFGQFVHEAVLHTFGRPEDSRGVSVDLNN